MRALDGFRIISQLVVDRAKIVERFCVVRLQANRFFVSSDRLLVIIRRCRLVAGLRYLRISIAKIVMRHRIVGLQANGFLKFSDRRVVLVERDQQTAEVRARFGVVWLDPDRFAISSRGFRILSRHVIGISEIVLSIGETGSGARGLEKMSQAPWDIVR